MLHGKGQKLWASWGVGACSPRNFLRSHFPTFWEGYRIIGYNFYLFDLKRKLNIKQLNMNTFIIHTYILMFMSLLSGKWDIVLFVWEWTFFSGASEKKVGAVNYIVVIEYDGRWFIFIITAVIIIISTGLFHVYFFSSVPLMLFFLFLSCL